jgi:hypothetical protein
MGQQAQIQSNQTFGQTGKGQSPASQGANGAITNSATSGQPQVGVQNQYSNTVGQWDNTQQQQPPMMGGKSKGA